MTAAFSRWASLASAPARSRAAQYPQQHEQQREQQRAPTGERGERQLPGAISARDAASSARCGGAALGRARALQRSPSPCVGLSLRARGRPAGGSASARALGGERLACRAHARRRRRRAASRVDARVTARRRAASVVAAANSVALVSAACSARTCAVAPCRSARGGVLRPDRDARDDRQQRHDRDDDAALGEPVASAARECPSRATPDSSAGTCHACGGSASLERGTLALKLGMPPAEKGTGCRRLDRRARALGRATGGRRGPYQVTLTLPFMPLAAWPLMAQ